MFGSNHCSVSDAIDVDQDTLEVCKYWYNVAYAFKHT